MLDAGRIIAEAEGKAGMADPETHLHANLAALVDSLNTDGRLGTEGEALAHRSLVGRQADRIEGLRWLRDYPEIGTEPITAPVFLTGLPRSGTTYLQYLFDADRRFRLIRTWEAIMPHPPPGHDPESVIRRKAMEAEINARLRPRIEGFDALHLIDEDGPQECHVFLEQAGAAAGFFNLHDVPGYARHLFDRIDLAAAYRVHRRQLQLLQWQAPRPRWALKYPNHIMAMDAILEVYSDARFVMTHRDPVQTLASSAKLTMTLRGARQDQPVDPHRIGRQMLDFQRRHIDRLMAFCTGPHAERVVHVDYYRCAADPVAIMPEVHAALGLDTPDDVQASMADWRAANPKGKRGSNAYALEQFGLAADQVRAHFADYIGHFAIPTETDGTKGH